mgnify:CR=1 FL=1
MRSKKPFLQFVGQQKETGSLYALRNLTMYPKALKLGLSEVSAQSRAKDLSRETSCVGVWKVAYEAHVRVNTHEGLHPLEQKIFALLDAERVDPRREIFELDLEKAVKVIRQVAGANFLLRESWGGEERQKYRKTRLYWSSGKRRRTRLAKSRSELTKS